MEWKLNYDKLREDLIEIGAHCDEYIGCEGCPRRDDLDFWCQNYNEHDLPNDMLIGALLGMIETFGNEETEHEVEHVAEHEVDMVEHPPHYCREGAMETIDEMELLFGTLATYEFCRLNAWKYRARATRKNGEEDLKKSDWYIRKAAELKTKMKLEGIYERRTENI